MSEYSWEKNRVYPTEFPTPTPNFDILKHEKHADEIIQHGKVVSHFKRTMFTEDSIKANPNAGLLIVWGRATNWDTYENLIVYQAGWDRRMWCRPMEMFNSPVDRIKYPKYDGQYWRFEPYDGPIELKLEGIPTSTIGEHFWSHINKMTQTDIVDDNGRWDFEVLADCTHTETGQKMYILRGFSNRIDNKNWAVPEKRFTDMIPVEKQYHKGLYHFTHEFEQYLGSGGVGMISKDNMYHLSNK